MAVTVVRLPRSFAGDKAASLEDFFNSMAHALSRGDPARKEAIQHFCNRVQVSLSARAVFDVGGLQKMSRKNMLQLLVSIEKDSEHWVDSIEDVLDFSFPTPVITHLQVGRDPALPPLSAALVPQSIGGLRTSSYVKEGELGLGAQLLSNGMLDTVVFKYAMFTKLVTSSPLEETITEAEVTHINDTVFEMTFTKYGRVTVDKIYRTHCGQKLRLLFPNLPNRGKIMGEDRKFEDMLKWRFSNARKAPVEGKIPYKAGMIIDRINLCEEAITMVDQMNFRLTVVNEGKLDTKFSIDDVDDDEGLDEMPKAQTEDDGKDNPNPRPFAYFGSEHSRKPSKGPLAPVTASAANTAAAAAAAAAATAAALAALATDATTDGKPQIDAPPPRKRKTGTKRSPRPSRKRRWPRALSRYRFSSNQACP